MNHIGTRSRGCLCSGLKASLKAMGGANHKAIQYSDNGSSWQIGQTYGLAED
jgi:hypothetical protein